jgi:hypothetical protein
MRDAPVACCESTVTKWRELYRCDDLKLARAVATCIAAMEFDVRVCSINPKAWDCGCDDAEHVCTGGAREEVIPGPHVIEVPADVWPQLAGVLGEIIDEQREFDEQLELRRERNRTRLVIVLSVTTAAEVLAIWRLLEA